MSYIAFEEAFRPKRYVTKVWNVVSKSSGVTLGQVRWYSAWRRYCFFPQPETVWSPDCQRDVAAFCEAQTAARKEERG